MAEARPSSAQDSSQQASSAQSQQASVPAQHGSPETEAMARTGEQRAEVEREVTPEVRGPLAGDPLALGLPAFIVGSVALGLVLVGFVSPLGTGASLPIILLATAIGLLISTLWAMAVGQSAVAMILGVFAGFWASYGFLVLGLQHGWFGITLIDLRSSQELFLIAWIVIMSMLTLATLRLAAAFTAVLLLVDVALICVLVGVINTSTNWLKAGGAIAFLFATIGVFIFFGTASVATGGKPIPLGRPIMPIGSARSRSRARTLGVSLTVSCRSFTACETPAAG
jgi:succinate-acetate transporter protein